MPNRKLGLPSVWAALRMIWQKLVATCAIHDITTEPGRDQGLCDVVRLVDRVTAALVLYDGRPAPSIDFHTGCLESRHACCEPVAGRAYDDRFRAHRLGMTKNPV